MIVSKSADAKLRPGAWRCRHAAVGSGASGSWRWKPHSVCSGTAAAPPRAMAPKRLLQRTLEAARGGAASSPHSSYFFAPLELPESSGGTIWSPFE
jgi:hypothetical protein